MCYSASTASPCTASNITAPVIQMRWKLFISEISVLLSETRNQQTKNSSTQRLAPRKCRNLRHIIPAVTGTSTFRRARHHRCRPSSRRNSSAGDRWLLLPPKHGPRRFVPLPGIQRRIRSPKAVIQEILITIPKPEAFRTVEAGLQFRETRSFRG